MAIYAAVSDLRNYLGDANSKLDSTDLTRVLTVASREVDQYTGRKFDLDSSVSARMFDGDNDGRILIDDVGSTSGLVVENSLDAVTYYTVPAAAYELGPLNTNLTSPDAWAFWFIDESPAVDAGGYGSWAWERRIRVTAKWGWSAIPAQVVQATIIRAGSLFRRKDAPFGVAGFDGYGAVRVRLDPDVQALLAPYRRNFGIA